MKKVALLLVLLVGLGMASVKQTTGANFVQVDIINEQVKPTKLINVGFQDVLTATKLDFIINSGNFTTGSAVTTASVRWIMSDGTQVSTNVLTAGTPITNMLSNWMSLVIINGATTRNFTGAIRLIK